MSLICELNLLSIFWSRIAGDRKHTKEDNELSSAAKPNRKKVLWMQATWKIRISSIEISQMNLLRGRIGKSEAHDLHLNPPS